jgi:hypothetical protein
MARCAVAARLISSSFSALSWSGGGSWDGVLAPISPSSRTPPANVAVWLDYALVDSSIFLLGRN